MVKATYNSSSTLLFCYDLVKWPSQYLYLFSFSFLLVSKDWTYEMNQNMWDFTNNGK